MRPSCAAFEGVWRWTTGVVLLLSPLPLLLYPDDLSAWVVYFSSIFTLLCVPNTLILVVEHATTWTQPRLQLCVVRIVLMVPIYAIDCWLSLVQSGSVLADTARECYEAFVIYNFVCYLVAYFGSEKRLEALLESKPPVGHLAPLSYCLPRWRMGRRYLYVCRIGALQYVVVRVTTSAIAAACELLARAMPWIPRFEEGNYASLYPYLALLNSVSQMWAMYCLLMFFRAVRHELAPLKPILKFMMVKSVVFLTFWQSLGLTFACHIGLIQPTRSHTAREVTSIISNALLCFEMFIFSLLHPKAFPASEYEEPADDDEGGHYVRRLAAAAEGGDGDEGGSLRALLCGALYEALVPQDVLLQVRKASWSVVNPEHLGLAGTRNSSSADLAEGRRSVDDSPVAGGYTPPAPPPRTPPRPTRAPDERHELSPGEKQAATFAAALR